MKSGKTNYVLYTLWISRTNNMIRVQKLENAGANGEKIFRSAVIGCHPVSSVPAPLPVAPCLLHSSWSSDIKITPLRN